MSLKFGSMVVGMAVMTVAGWSVYNEGIPIAFEEGRQAGLAESRIALVCEPTTNRNGDAHVIVSFENGEERIFVKNKGLVGNAYIPIAQAKTRELENLKSKYEPIRNGIVQGSTEELQRLSDSMAEEQEKLEGRYKALRGVN